jgi:hypothetical protein
MVIRAYNPGYLGSRNWDDYGPAPLQKHKRSSNSSQPSQLGIVEHACHPSYGGSINRRMAVQSGLGIKDHGPIKTKAKKDCGYGSSGEMPA